MGTDTNPKVVVLYWHRTDLRLHDSPALQAALALNPSVFIPVWTWDPHYAYQTLVGPNRWKFLLDCQNDISRSYTSLNPKQKLWVVREGPQTVLPKLWKQWGVTHLVFEKDTDSYARERDDRIVKTAKDAGVEVIVKMGRNLFDPDEVVEKNGGKPTTSISQLEKAVERINGGQPEKPLSVPESIPDPWDENQMDIRDLEQSATNPPDDLNVIHRTVENKQYEKLMGPDDSFRVPTMEEMGINTKQATSPHKGGESEALKILEGYIKDDEYIGKFDKPSTSPAEFEPQSTTLLSPHLHFGSLSVRKYWWEVQRVLEERKRQKKKNTSIPTNLHGQLLFRDMYFAAQAALGEKFAQIRGNNLCKFIDWHLQSDYREGPKGGILVDRTYDADSAEAENWFQRWKEGRTGFPWIDALMRQLRQDGWIHHLGRHSVGCFLTRGGCYVSWERGAEVFEELLIDHETASNVGNWLWVSCSAFFFQYYRCYSPISFGKKWDPEGHLIRRYCPELANFDKKYIYEPWRAPTKDQKAWGCRVTGNGSANDSGPKKDSESVYPAPMFDFNERRQVCIAGMKHAYHLGMHGDDESVKDGSWRDLFKDQDASRSSKRQKTDR
ncbi:hypothetical protein FQN54_009871 [Arachnomyces sp. PD_36]|nr:hypothetical protein FQN54_009871 [Arachnomyces sp. PD_36]